MQGIHILGPALFSLFVHLARSRAFAVALPEQASVAAEDDASALVVVVTVLDEHGRPQADALVETAGEPTIRIIGRTGPSGTLTVHLVRGDRLQARAGSARSPIEPAEGPTLRLVVRLPTIAATNARATLPGERTTAASARALISGDVTGGLGYIPNYRSAAEGGSGHQSLNGVPLDLPAPPGSGSASGAVPSDLVASFDAVQADDGSYPDYHLFSPTPEFSAALSAAAASFDGSTWKATIGGPHGTLHYAVALASGSDEGRLAGQRFADQSGVVYDHGSDAHHTDVSLTGNTALGAINLSFLGFDSRHGARYVATNEPGAIVQGLGPGNRIADDTGLEFLLATWSRGRDSFSAIDGRYRGGATFDFANALIDGSATPSDSGYRYFGHFDDASWTRNFGQSSLSLKAAVSGNVADGFSNDGSSTLPSDSNSVSTQSQSLGLSYRLEHSNGSAGASLTARNLSGPFSGAVLEATAFAERKFGGTDARISASSTEAQSEEAGYATASTLDPPQRATIVCEPATATVGAPAQTGTTHPRARTLALSLARGGESGSLRAGAFRSDITNALVPADVGGVAFAPAYAAQLSSFFRSLCPGESLAPANTFVQRYESAAILRQAEAYVDATRQIGPLSLEAFYETFADAPAQTPPDLVGLRTTLAPHGQVANVPLHRAGLIAAFTHGSAMIGLGARLISANNEADLPAHVVTDAGIHVRLARGTLETSVQNLFDCYNGVFTSPRYAVPLATTTGALYTLATPLQRTWTLRYSVVMGPHS